MSALTESSAIGNPKSKGDHKMKTAKRILLCTLVLAMLGVCFSMNTSALSLGPAKPYTDANGAKLFDIYLWNYYEPGPTYILYADLTLYEAADYTFAACYASIQGRNPNSGEIESYDGDAQWDDYFYAKDLWDFAAVRITNGNSCTDNVTMPANFIPYKAEGTAIVGYSGYGDYRYKFSGYAGDNNPVNIKFTPVRDETHSILWRNP